MTKALMLTVASLVLTANVAGASVVISTKPTAHMTCSGGVCTPTAKKAVLNATDLANMLAAGDVKVVTGTGAVTITVSAPVSWASSHRLTLDAYYRVSLKAPVVVAGQGSVTITYNDGGTGGDFVLFPGASLDFWDLSSSLVIGGQNYILEAKLADLSNAIDSNPSGFFALAANYDATNDGNYTNSALPGLSKPQTFEGLGHTISNLSIVFNGFRPVAGLFPRNRGTIRDIGVTNVTIGLSDTAGGITGDNEGVIINSYVTGTIDAYVAGGLTGVNEGVIRNCHADVTINASYADAVLAGGLAGQNNSLLEMSYATGAVLNGNSAGGLVGENDGAIANSYARDGVRGVDTGGLVGYNKLGTISDSLSTGTVAGSVIGGLVGVDDKEGNGDTYWNLDTSGITNPDQGAGDPLNDPGIKGLGDVKLKSHLPTGFDRRVWKHNAALNDGYPYLVDNPPQ